MKRNNSMTERMNKNEPPKYWRNPFKGEKCNKKPGPIQNESVVKKQRTNMVANIRCRQKFGYLTMQIIFADLRLRRAGVTFHFYVHNVYSFHIFIRFPSPRSFRFVLKSRTMAVSAGLTRREPFSCTRLLSLVIIPIFLYLLSFFSLILSTHKWLIRSPRVCCSNNM